MFKNYPDVLTIEDLMEILHYKSKTTIYKLLRSGQIKSIHEKRGNRYLIPKKSLIDYLLDNKD
ncbi:MAG: helix-turn-helix domain-containing protein [Lachnospiraceae bacterium]|nr:helix-turn-helix domain-containing protein [Lachnospiraceae bacterium]